MSKRTTLLTTAAAAALVGAMTSGAWAFEVVDWDWTSSVTTDVEFTPPEVVVDLDGWTQVQGLNMSFGNKTATQVTNVVNVDAEALPPINGVTLDASANAIANIASVDTSTPQFVHIAQIGAGEIDGGAGPNPTGFLLGATALTELDDQLGGINEHTDIAFLTLLAAGTGFVAPAAITASSQVDTATATYTTNVANAITNNGSFKVTTGETTPGFFIGDVTQVSIADNTAAADLRSLTIFPPVSTDPSSSPTVSNSANAIGNNLNIKVNAPTL